MSDPLSLNAIQNKIDEYIKNHGGYWPPLSMFSALVEEIGELAREINSFEGFKPKKSSEKENRLGEELSDVLFALICLANYYEINLEVNLNKIIEKYKKRDKDRFIQ
ncbi:MAG: hypothetical protein EU532_07200 [Promethearchaeota archaeon]|nr:MAG: hypothetical protein EU532_07200 [Candidatus Lokiarchaeota archaeon]